MKIKNVVLCSALMLAGFTHIHAQWALGGGPADRFGNSSSGPPVNQYRSIGVGNFTGYGAHPLAVIHANQFYLFQSPSYAPGEMFRTDANSANISAWRMFTGVNPAGSVERFAVFVPAFSANVFLQSTRGDLFFNTAGGGPIFSVQERMHIMQSPGNQAGIAKQNATKVNISYGAGYAPITVPTAMLNLGFDPPQGPNGGQRAWMDVGTFMCASSDNMYVGLKNEAPNGDIGPNPPSQFNDRQDAVVNWGDNNASLNPYGPDRLRFIFTMVQNPATATGAASANGLEVMRMAPQLNGTTIFTGIGGDPAVNLYGPAQNSTDPTQTLEVNSTGATNVAGGSSGLRFTNLNITSPVIAVNPGPGVLAVNANGDVIYVAGGATGTGIGNYCTAPAQNPLTGNYEVPMNNFNYYFSDGAISSNTTNNVGIGVPCSAPLPAKLTLNESTGATNSIGILSRNSGTSSACIMAVNTGTGGTMSNPQVGGWFQTIPDQYAIVVPKSGGKVSIGYTSPVTGPSFSWNGFVTATPNAQLDVAGSIYMGGQLVNASDSSLKHNISSITNALGKVNRLRGVTFEWNSTEDTLMYGVHAGFIAQEVDTVIPQLVHTAPNGIKSIAYTEMIPYLVKAIQEQEHIIDSMNTQLNAMQSQINGCCSSARTSSQDVNATDVHLSNDGSIVLNQNVPNPFAEQTTINYFLPENVLRAQMLFYDATGKLIKAAELEGKGKGQLNVFADDLSNGIYSYALVVDGQVIDTKRMVKTN